MHALLILSGHDQGVDTLTSRLIRTWALNAVDQAIALADADPKWGSETHAVGDGWLILSGQDMYVNRAMSVGIDGPVTNADIDIIVSRCRLMGVQPSFEVTPFTLPATVDRLRIRGFVHDSDADITALVRPIPGPPIDAPDDIIVRPVTTEADLALWQEISATGWGHVDRRARAVSDAFTTAALITDRDGMVIAFDSSGDHPVGCASVTIREGLATLGGMSTHPAHRRRGVQAALIRHRLRLASKHGCDLAAATAAAGGASVRNLCRHGFRSVFEIATWKS